jgi:hypothetical protein
MCQIAIVGKSCDTFLCFNSLMYPYFTLEALARQRSMFNKREAGGCVVRVKSQECYKRVLSYSRLRNGLLVRLRDRMLTKL